MRGESFEKGQKILSYYLAAEFTIPEEDTILFLFFDLLIKGDTYTTSN